MNTITRTLERSTTAARPRSDGLRRVTWILRVGAGLCFIGHGAFGVLGKAAWLPYFAVVGIGPELAFELMPIIGVVDILVGLLVIFWPHPAALAYMVFWAFWTAVLRPLAGEPVWETLERAGNYGVPLALLLLVVGAGGSHGADRSGADETRRKNDVSPHGMRWTLGVLRWTTALLLAGHGALGLITRKPLLAEHYASIGLSSAWLPAVGAFELVLALAVLLSRQPVLYAGVAVWKLSTELLFPLSGAPVWEFIERAGSYAAPLAVLALGSLAAPVTRAASPSRIRRTAVAVALALLATLGVGAGTVNAQARSGAAPDSTAVEHEDVLEELRSGGFVLVLRHTHTDRSNGDARRVDYNDRTTQRNLSERGEDEARELGRLFERLAIPVGDVFASPYFRNRETAELAFGRVEVDRALAYGGDRERVRRLMTDVPPAGRNRVLVTHYGVMARMPGFRGRDVDEGDLVVLRPDGREYDILAVIGLDDWRRMARGEQGERRAPAIEAARAGGAVILCRHAATGSFREREPVDYDDPSTQRRLSEQGRRQSRALGRALRTLGVQLEEVIASPMQRALTTARLIVDGAAPVTVDSVWHTNDGNYGGSHRERRAAALRRAVSTGSRLIVSHIGTMRSVVPDGVGRIGEGDCVVVRPAPGVSRDGYDVIGVVTPREWARAARS